MSKIQGTVVHSLFLIQIPHDFSSNFHWIIASPCSTLFHCSPCSEPNLALQLQYAGWSSLKAFSRDLQELVILSLSQSIEITVPSIRVFTFGIWNSRFPVSCTGDHRHTLHTLYWDVYFTFGNFSLKCPLYALTNILFSTWKHRLLLIPCECKVCWWYLWLMILCIIKRWMSVGW